MTPGSMHSLSVYREQVGGRRDHKVADTGANGFGLSLVERAANAVLISRAPSMLDVLERIATATDDPSIRAMALEEIEKAVMG